MVNLPYISSAPLTLPLVISLSFSAVGWALSKHIIATTSFFYNIFFFLAIAINYTSSYYFMITPLSYIITQAFSIFISMVILLYNFKMKDGRWNTWAIIIGSILGMALLWEDDPIVTLISTAYGFLVGLLIYKFIVVFEDGNLIIRKY